MSVATKVSSPTATGVAPATARIGAGVSAASAATKIEGLSAGNFVGIADEDFLGTFGERGHQREQPDYYASDRHGGFTPLVHRFALGYQANEITPVESRGLRGFLTDVMRAIGLYEFTLRVTAGTAPPPGANFNRML